MPGRRPAAGRALRRRPRRLQPPEEQPRRSRAAARRGVPERPPAPVRVRNPRARVRRQPRRQRTELRRDRPGSASGVPSPATSRLRTWPSSIQHRVNPPSCARTAAAPSSPLRTIRRVRMAVHPAPFALVSHDTHSCVCLMQRAARRLARSWSDAPAPESAGEKRGCQKIVTPPPCESGRSQAQGIESRFGFQLPSIPK